MCDFAPCLYDILLRVCHIVERDGHWISLVTEPDDCLCATLHSLLLVALIIETRGKVTVAVLHGERRLEEVLVA